MNPALTSFAGGGVGLLVFSLAALVLLRIPSRVAPVLRLGLLAAVVHGLTAFTLESIAPGATYWHGAALYWFGFMCFLFGFGAVYKSVSLRILGELAAAKDHRLTMKEIVDAHVRKCFTERMALLLQAGLAQTQAEKYSTAPRGAIMAGRIALVQNLCGVERTGLYGSGGT